MKNGKPTKNSTAPLPSEKPARTVSKRKLPVHTTVANTRETTQRVEPTPQPSEAKIKRATPKKVAHASPEPTPQPRPVRAKKISAKLKSAEPKKLARETPSAPKPPPRAPQVITEESAPQEIAPRALTPPVSVAPTPAPLLPSRPSVPGPAPSKPRAVRQPRPVPVEIPSILLEPDHTPNEPAIAGPGARFALTPNIETVAAAPPEELPESYGTQRIFLAARDPYCLFASWDLDPRQRSRYNAESASGALTIRLRRGHAEGPIFLEVHTLPNSRDRFIEVAQPDATFVAELGYHEKNSGLWRTISHSRPATTPRDRVAPAPAPIAPPVQAPIAPPPPAAPLQPQTQPQPQREERREQIIFAIQSAPEPRWVAKQEPEPFRERPRWQPSKEKPRWIAPKKVPAPKWSPAKTKALDELISLEFRRMQKGSIEIEELLRRRILRSETEHELEVPSSLELQVLAPEEMLAEALGLAQPPSSAEIAALPPEARKGFWFRVNAELIIYGSTEPDAHVSIGGRPIRLRPDGSFSYRFALPDGAYELPVIAIANDGHDGRAADLRFSRATRYSGDVPPHAQDAALKPPAPDNL